MAQKEDTSSKSETKAAIGTEGLADAAKVVQDAAEQIIRFSKNAAESANVEFKAKAKLAEEAVASGVKTSTNLIKKYPLESALVCFGVGVLAGVLLKKRD